MIMIKRVKNSSIIIKNLKTKNDHLPLGNFALYVEIIKGQGQGGKGWVNN